MTQRLNEPLLASDLVFFIGGRPVRAYGGRLLPNVLMVDLQSLSVENPNVRFALYKEDDPLSVESFESPVESLLNLVMAPISGPGVIHTFEVQWSRGFISEFTVRNNRDHTYDTSITRIFHSHDPESSDKYRSEVVYRSTPYKDFEGTLKVIDQTVESILDQVSYCSHSRESLGYIFKYRM